MNIVLLAVETSVQTQTVTVAVPLVLLSGRIVPLGLVEIQSIANTNAESLTVTTGPAHRGTAV